MDINKCTLCGLETSEIEIFEYVCTQCKEDNIFDECVCCGIIVKSIYLFDDQCPECNCKQNIKYLYFFINTKTFPFLTNNGKAYLYHTHHLLG